VYSYGMFVCSCVCSYVRVVCATNASMHRQRGGMASGALPKEGRNIPSHLYVYAYIYILDRVREGRAGRSEIAKASCNRCVHIIDRK
jgi:hypothetical protein